MREVTLPVTVTLRQMIEGWIMSYVRTATPENFRIAEKYETALFTLGALFAQRHEQMDDGEFVRIFRFLREVTDMERVCDLYPDAAKRFEGLLYKEP